MDPRPVEFRPDMPGVPVDHPVTKLAAALLGWEKLAPAGDRTPKLLIEVRDSIGRVHGAPKLTERQAEELAAGMVLAAATTSSAWAIADYLADWRAPTGVQPAAQITMVDWRIGDLELDTGEKPEPITVPIAADRLNDLTTFLEVLLQQLLLARDLVPTARYQEGQRVLVVDPKPKDGEPFAGAGHTGVISYVQVLLPQRDGKDVEFWYHVWLNVPAAENGGYALCLVEDELRPADNPSTGGDSSGR